MPDVLLAHSYFLKYDAKQTQKMKPYPPLATLYIASHLRSNGYSVALFDAMLSEGEHEFASVLSEQQPRYVVLYEDNFNFLSKMCLTRMREAACTISAMAHAAGAVVIASGSDVSDHPELYFSHGVHYAVLGEGDHTVLELLRVLDRPTEDEETCNAEVESIKGLAYPTPHGLHRTAKRPTEKNPNRFELPAWDLVDVGAYRAAWVQEHGYFSLNMVSTRGCPYHCNWCAKPIWGQHYAMRSPANVAEELVYLKRTLKPDHIWFADDIFGLRPQWVAEFGREVAQQDAAIPFMIQSRADLMTDEAVAGLQQAGCTEVWLGAESGSQKILDAMDKGIRIDQLYSARARLKAAGIRACFFIQFGYPGETWDDILQTIAMVRQNVPDNIGISVSYPLPGTRFHEMVKNQLGDKQNWIDSNDLEMLFKGSYQSPFYRKLHQLLHAELDAVLQQQISLDLPTLWDELHELERTCRNDEPTQLVKPYDIPVIPDLSKPWN